MDTVIEIILKDIAAMRDSLVDAKELATAKTICITMDLMSRQTNGAMAQEAALNELYGLGYDHWKEYGERITAVTAADVQRVARKYLTHHMMVRTGPAEAPAEEKGE